MASKKSLRLINFRIEPEIIEKLNNLENKSEFIREAVKKELKIKNLKKWRNTKNVNPK